VTLVPTEQLWSLRCAEQRDDRGDRGEV